MSKAPSVVFFAEGTIAGPLRRGEIDPFESIWKLQVPTALDIIPPHRVIGINKKNLVAMDRSMPPMSSFSIGLDDIIANALEREPFDIAVILWDLVPPWSPVNGFCRWEETKSLYKGLSESRRLPNLWRKQAADRLEDLCTRPTNAARAALQELNTGQVFAVCMEPMFEILLALCEDIVMDIFQLRKRPAGWPNDWPGVTVRPDIEIIQKAITTARKISPTPSVFRIIRGDMINNKHEWGEFILRQILNNPHCVDKLRNHATSTRLTDLLSVNRV